MANPSLISPPSFSLPAVLQQFKGTISGEQVASTAADVVNGLQNAP